MKKFLYVLFFLIVFQGLVFADNRTFSIRNGITSIHGTIPTSTYGVYTDCDIFMMQISRDKYYMLVDNGKTYNRHSLLGCDGGAKINMFDPLKELNTDNNNRLTPEELKKANIRFVKVNSMGRLDVRNKNSDFPLDQIAYIDLRQLRFSLTLTPNGSFDIYIKTDTNNLKKVIAKVNAKTHRFVDNLF